jgi:hypothetical protein
MIVELIFVSSVAVLSYLAGNIIGWSSGKTHFEMLINGEEYQQDMEHERLIDDISRQSLAFSQKQKHWIKVYDAEVIE